MQNRVRILRKERDLTQKELSERIGVSRQAINAIETSKFDPSVWLAYDLARFFSITICGSTKKFYTFGNILRCMRLLGRLAARLAYWVG